MTRLIACILTWLIWSVAAADQQYPFRVETRSIGQEHALVAVNDGPATITLSAQVKGENVGSDRNWPLVDVIKPHSSNQIARIFAAVPGAGYRFKTRYSHAFGDVTKVPDKAISYRLPFADGFHSTVGQAPNGEITTHTAPDSRYAVDFTMPENTPIVAARGGTVIDVKDNFSAGGPNPNLLDKANVITILHSDGSMALYVHLITNGARVQVGQVVQAGQLIGYSGNTGYSTGPHLHFALTRAKVKTDGTVASESIPVAFYAFQPPVRFEAKQNMAVMADYSNTGSPDFNSMPSKRVEMAERPILPPPLPVAETPGPAEPYVLAIHGQEVDVLEEIERHTGYPWWAWIGSIVACIVMLRLWAEFKATLRPEMAELSRDWKGSVYDPREFRGTKPPLDSRPQDWR
ncbi:MAG: peptidase M23 [Rhodocyclaceae bacterium]|nr:MAG: peptidase M23 [Rhodocyclaceae bacterium]